LPFPFYIKKTDKIKSWKMRRNKYCLPEREGTFDLEEGFVLPRYPEDPELGLLRLPTEAPLSKMQTYKESKREWGCHHRRTELFSWLRKVVGWFQTPV